MGHEDLCNTGLVLGLGCSPKLENGLIYNHHRANASIKPDHSLFSSDQEPTLTLSLADDTYKESNKIGANKAIQQSTMSPHSTISSFSACIKRERDVVAGEDGEIEKVSCRVSDEDDDGSARKKLRLTKEQSALLEDSFKEHSTLNPKQKLALAKQLNLRPRQVEVWFQNRRARTKLKQTEVDCEFLKRCCEALTDENRRLQKELQELKAMNLASPFCMRFPAATVTMCPSCERIGVGGGGGDRAKNPFAIVPRSHQLYNPFTHSSAAC